MVYVMAGGNVDKLSTPAIRKEELAIPCNEGKRETSQYPAAISVFIAYPHFKDNKNQPTAYEKDAFINHCIPHFCIPVECPT